MAPHLQTELARWNASLYRRCFLQRAAGGLGGMALASLLHGTASGSPSGPRTDPLAPKQPHFAARAKRVIFLFMAGAPSQLDLFQSKPELTRLHGQPVPASFLAGLDDALVKGSARVMASPR